MRKSKIIKENLVLFNQINELREEIESLKVKLQEKDKEINRLNNEASSNKANKASAPLKEIEKKVMRIDTPDDVSYGSTVIGQIVVDSANYSNILTSNGETKYIELVNLILGKAEVAKSDILSVVSEDIPIEIKKEKIQSIKKATSEYFESVMAQR